MLIGEVEGEIGAERETAGTIGRIERKFADPEGAVRTRDPE